MSPALAARPASDLPLVSAIVPAYNHERFVGATLQAIEDQTYPNLEIVVVDDGSTDGTPQVIAAFLARSRRPHVHVRQANSGLAKTFQRGFAESHGDLVSFCDSDDVWFLDKTERQVHDLQASGCDAVLGSWAWLRPDGGSAPYKDAQDFRGRWDAEEFITNLVQSRGPGLQGSLFRRSLIESIGGMYHGLPLNDWPVLIQAARAARCIRVDPEPVFAYRLHEGNFTSRRHLELLDWKLATARKYCSPAVQAKCAARAHRLVADEFLRQGHPYRAAAHFARARRHGPQPRTAAFLRDLRRALVRRHRPGGVA